MSSKRVEGMYLHQDDFFAMPNLCKLQITPEQNRFTLPATNIFAPENLWLEYQFPFEKACFREGTAFPWDDHVVDSIVSIAMIPKKYLQLASVTERMPMQTFMIKTSPNVLESLC